MLYQGKQVVYFNSRQACGWLVHNNNPGILVQCLCYFNHLLFGSAEVRDSVPRLQVQIQYSEYLLCTPVQLFPLNKPHFSSWLIRYEYIFTHGEIGNQVSVLIDSNDTQILSYMGV